LRKGFIARSRARIQRLPQRSGEEEGTTSKQILLDKGGEEGFGILLDNLSGSKWR